MDYSTVTETPGDRIRQDALAEMYTRYAHARALCAGKDVLEVACGPGPGLGLLATSARAVVGGDYSASLAARASTQYCGRIPVVRLDAHRLPFQNGSFDVILLYEAVYYLDRAGEFFDEARRLLRRGGTLVVCTTNKDSFGFNPSPFSTRYPSARDLQTWLREAQFDVDVYGAFPERASAQRDRLVSLVRRAAVALCLVPRTMKGKAVLKRLFYGRLIAVPGELTDAMTPVEPLVPLVEGQGAADYKVVYAFARVAQLAFPSSGSSDSEIAHD